MSFEVSETLILYRISPTVVRLQVNYAARMNETGNVAWAIVTKPSVVVFRESPIRPDGSGLLDIHLTPNMRVLTATATFLEQTALGTFELPRLPVVPRRRRLPFARR
jgi:hypothetical protein